MKQNSCADTIKKYTFWSDIYYPASLKHYKLILSNEYKTIYIDGYMHIYVYTYI